MAQTLTIIGYVTAALAAGFLIASVAMFFGFKIPELYRDLNGKMAQKQIEEIRRQKNSAQRQRGKVNVFEELEKQAGAQRATTGATSQTASSGMPAQREPTPASATPAYSPGTTVLQSGVANQYQDFTIEKDMVFVSTTEVL